MCGTMTQTSHIKIFFFQAEDGIRGLTVTGVQTCALPIYGREGEVPRGRQMLREGDVASRQGRLEVVDAMALAVEIGRASCRERVWVLVDVVPYNRKQEIIRNLVFEQ